MDLHEYREAIERLAATKSDLEFPNSSVAHASIVVETLIKYSESEIRIYDDSISGDLDIDSSISNQIKSSVVDQGKKLKVVVRHTNGSTTAIYDVLKSLSKSHPKLVEVKIASETFKNAIKSNLGNDLNFATGDKNAYRLENLEKKDGEIIRTAVGSFNRPDKTKKLVQLFDDNYSSCTSYPF